MVKHMHKPEVKHQEEKPMGMITTTWHHFNIKQDQPMNVILYPTMIITSPNIGSKNTWGWYLLHVGCHSSPLPTQDLVPRSKHEKARDTQNGDDLHAPTLPPYPSDVPTAP